jgi:hypothetical protein
MKFTALFFTIALFLLLVAAPSSARAQAQSDSLKAFRVMDGDDPKMISALQMLREARAELNKAEPDKGGHRVRAIKEINRAITEIKKGVVFDRKNITEKERKQMLKQAETTP